MRSSGQVAARSVCRGGGRKPALTSNHNRATVDCFSCAPRSCRGRAGHFETPIGGGNGPCVPGAGQLRGNAVQSMFGAIRSLAGRGLPARGAKCSMFPFTNHESALTNHAVLPGTVTRVESLVTCRKQTTAHPLTRNVPAHDFRAISLVAPSTPLSHSWRANPPADAIIELPFGGAQRSKRNRA